MSFGGSGGFPNYGSTRKSGNFRNDTTIYNQLCDNISCNIFEINNSASALEQALRSLGTENDTQHLQDKIHQTQRKTNDIISSTTRFLKELADLVQRGEREQKLQSERLRNEFHDTIERYCMLEKQVAAKMKVTRSSMTKHTSPWTEDSYEADVEENHSLVASERIQQQRQLEEELMFEHEMLLEREQHIRQIEAEMLDINLVFRDLAQIVHEQGEDINTIEGNIVNTAENIESGHENLIKASSYQKKFRQKMCGFVILLLIIAVIIVIIVVSIHH